MRPPHEGDEALKHVLQRSCGDSKHGSVQIRVGWHLEQPRLAGGVPAHVRGVGTRWSLKFWPTQTIPWLYDSMIKRHTAISLYSIIAISHLTETNKLQKQAKLSEEPTDFSFLTRCKGKGRSISCQAWVKMWAVLCCLSFPINEHMSSNCFAWGGMLVTTSGLE